MSIDLLFDLLRNDVLPAGYRSHLDNLASLVLDEREIDVFVNQEEPIVS